MAPEVKLSRRALERAERHVGLAMGARDWRAELSLEDAETVLAATRALLRVMEPASDEEMFEAVNETEGNPAVPSIWYRAAEDRARRVAGWVDESRPQAEPALEAPVKARRERERDTSQGSW